MLDLTTIWEGIKTVGFPIALVIYLLYITQTDLKELKEKVIELDTYIRTKLGGGS